MLALFLNGCGTLTGLPSHGGGKRFAIEQELVAAASRAALKDLDLRPLVNRNIALYISVMGDQGSGTISGGRYSIDALIRGEYINAPHSETSYRYPRYQSTVQSQSGGLNSSTVSQSLLNAPSFSSTQSNGISNKRGIGLSMNGMGNYANETLVTNPRDVSYLTHLIQTIFYLRGINVVPQQFADTDVFITVDVFGTIRSRTELHIYNAESLKAATKLELFAVDRRSRQLVARPSSVSFEAEYKENYALWMGPYQVKKVVKRGESLLTDFSDITPYNKPYLVNDRNVPEVNENHSKSIEKEIIYKRKRGN